MTWTAAVAFGDGVALVHDDVAVLLEPGGEAASDLVARLWTVLCGGTSLDDLVDVLSTAGAAVESYAVAARDGEDIRVVVRGNASATLDGPSGSTDVDAHALRSWLEHSGPAHSVVIRLGEVGGTRLDVAPVQRAVLPASRIECSARDVAPITTMQPRPVGLGADDEPTAVQQVIARAPTAEPVAAAHPAPPVAPGRDDTDDEFGLDRMFGHTVPRSVPRAAVEAARSAPPATDPFASPPVPGTSRAELTPPGGAPRGDAPPVERVAAITLLHHLGDPAHVVDDLLGASCSLAFVGGPDVSLQHPLLIGRNPQPTDEVGADVVLVKIEAGHRLSRTHALVRVADGQVLLRDLGSANGTVYTEPGRSTRAARPHETIQVEPGTIIDFGGAAVAAVVGPT